MEQVLDGLIKDFDLTYCFIVNLLTYFAIAILTDFDINVTKWKKRIVLVIVIIVLGIICYLLGASLRVLVNSAILAPVSWSWIFKPLCIKFNIDYKNYDRN